MRANPTVVLALLAAGTLVASSGFIRTGLTAGLSPRPIVDTPKKTVDTDVDVELVIAVDISYSMDPDEQALQREGYMLGLTSAEFLNALKQGIHGKVAVTYFEWAGSNDQRIVVPWRLVDGEASARALADEIGAAPLRRAYRTSISGALLFGAPLFETSDHHGIRRVIDVSGDGANNQGPPVTVIRDQVLEQGITINGLPIMLKRAMQSNMDIENLDIYYEDCVIGGPGAFMIPIQEREKFKEATRTKLIQEIATREIAPKVVRVAASEPRISCLIGERMWQYRWGNGGRDFN